MEELKKLIKRIMDIDKGRNNYEYSDLKYVKQMNNKDSSVYSYYDVSKGGVTHFEFRDRIEILENQNYFTLSGLKNVDFDGVDINDYPKFSDAFIIYAENKDGVPLYDFELDMVSDNSELVDELLHDFLH